MIRRVSARDVLFSETLDQLLQRRDLEGPAVESVLGRILDGALTPAQVAAFAIALRAKGETPDEIASAARALRQRAHVVRPEVAQGTPIFDTCGTGGDGASTFNVSTTTAIVVAACGVTVAKHGNRAISSRSGSADVIEALGIPIDAPPDHGSQFDARLRRSMEDARIAFLFAPRHHAALRHVAPVRRELGVRTVFNLLGPLANPGGATHQLVGVYDDARRATVARVLGLLGLRRAWVVHAPIGGGRGLDEVSPEGPTSVSELLADGSIVERTIEPADAGLPRVALESLAGGDAEQNAALTRAIIGGDRRAGPQRTAVLLNAACALVVAGEAKDVREGRERAEHAIASGAAERTLSKWRSIMRDEPTS